MDLRHLRYFIAVAEELNFTRAAERLHLGQPPLSQQIQALEQELGARLFNRTSRHVELTLAGERLLVRARQILGQVQEAAEEIGRVGRGQLGKVTIGFTASIPLIAGFREGLKQHRASRPEVVLELVEMTTRAQFEGLRRRRLDVGFVRLDAGRAPEDLTLAPWYEDPLWLAVHREHPWAGRRGVTLDQCATEAFVGFPPEAGAGLTGLLKRLCGLRGFEPRIVQEAREPLTQLGLVAAGLGICIVPAPFRALAIADVRYLRLRDADAVFKVAMACRAGEDSVLVRSFLDLFRQRRRHR